MLAIPFVASPFDRDLAGARSKLVGFLLHPIPQSGTRRRLIVLQAADRPLAQGFGGRAILADVSIWRRNSESTTPKFYWKTGIFSRRWKGVVDN
jgi:hypothetical protein